MLPVQKKLISINFTDTTINPEYIVIHETDNESKGATALAHYKYWNRDNTACASAHFVVDSDNIIQMVEINKMAWHCGRKYGTTPIQHVSNNNSIGIEICVNADGDYTKARQNAIDLVKYLLKETGLDADKVIRHYDACLKYCPRKMMDQPQLWNDFKAALIENKINERIDNMNIKELQETLNRLGFKDYEGKPLVVDGLYGRRTESAKAQAKAFFNLIMQ